MSRNTNWHNFESCQTHKKNEYETDKDLRKKSNFYKTNKWREYKALNGLSQRTLNWGYQPVIDNPDSGWVETGTGLRPEPSRRAHIHAYGTHSFRPESKKGKLWRRRLTKGDRTGPIDFIGGRKSFKKRIKRKYSVKK